MKPDAAIAALALAQRYHQDTGDYLTVNEGYRNWEGQNYWHNRDPRSPVGGSIYANHGWGAAFDLEPDSIAEPGRGTAIQAQRLRWMRLNAGQFGYTELADENWHWNYSGTYAGAPAAPPIYVDLSEDGMFIRNGDSVNTGYVAGGWTFQMAPDGKLMPLSAEQSQLAIASGAKIFNWSGRDIYNHSVKSGMWEFTGSISGSDPGSLTGYLLFGNGVKALPGSPYPPNRTFI